MFSGYHYKIEDAFTSAVGWLPRWFNATAHPTIYDGVATPEITPFVTSAVFANASGAAIPAAWQLTNISPVATGSILQRVFEAYLAQGEVLWTGLINQALSQSMFFDRAEPDFAWLVDTSDDEIHKVEVLDSDGNRVVVQRAASLHELFWSGDRRWFNSDGTVLLYGLAFQEQTSETRSGAGNWQFVSSASTWSSGAILFWEHPHTRNWLPKHPSLIRSDGFLNIYSDLPIRLRSHFLTAAQQLSGVVVYVDDEKFTARLVNLWTSTDEKGLWEGTYRNELESSEDYGESLIQAMWFGQQTTQGLTNNIAANLRQGRTFTVSRSATGFELPNTAIGFTVRHLNQYMYVSELMAYDTNNTEYFRSMFTDPSFGIIKLNGTVLPSVNVSGSVYNLGIDIENNRTLSPVALWGLKNWDVSGTTVTFTDNLNQYGPDLIVFYPTKVRVSSPTNKILRETFKKKSPFIRWQTRALNPPQVKGLATFQ